MCQSFTFWLLVQPVQSHQAYLPPYLEARTNINFVHEQLHVSVFVKYSFLSQISVTPCVKV